MPNSSSNFYSLKRSALLFLSISTLLMLSIVDERASILGVGLTAGSLKVFSALIYGAALFYAASYFLTAYIDIRKVYLNPLEQLQGNEKSLDALAGELRGTLQKLPINREEIELPKASEIAETLKAAPNAAELLKRWDERSIWALSDAQFDDNVRHRVGRLVGQGISESISLSSDPSRAHDGEITEGVRQAAKEYFNQNAWPSFFTEVKAEVKTQSAETRAYFDDLSSRVESHIAGKVEGLANAIDRHADRVRPLVDEIAPTVERVTFFLDDISAAIAAVKVRFWLFDIAPVAILASLTLAHFVGLAFPLQPTAGELFNPSNCAVACR